MKTKTNLQVALIIVMGLMIAVSGFYLGRSDQSAGRMPTQAPPSSGVEKRQSLPIATSATSATPTMTAQDGTVLIFDGKEYLSQLDRDLLAAGRTDVKSGIEFANTHYPEPKRQRALEWLLVQLAKDDLEAMTTILPLLTSEVEHTSALQLIADYWASNNIAVYRNFVNANFKGTEKNNIYRDLAKVLARKGLFDEAITTLQEMPESSARTSAATDIARPYATKDPMKAIQSASSLGSYDERTATQSALLRTLSETDSIEAMKVLMASVPEAKRGPVLQEIGRVLGKKGVSALSPDPVDAESEKDHGYLLLGAVYTVPRAEMPALGEQLVKIVDPGPRVQATANYVSRLFDIDQREAIAWVNTAPQEIRAAAMSALTSSWYRTDAQAALHWVDALPKGWDQDWALESLTWKCMQNEPDRAMEFAQRVTDGRIRDGLVHNIQARRH